MDKFNNIRISKIEGEKVTVKNASNFPLIGKGKQGAVFKLSPTKCVKIFEKRKLVEKEADAYERAKHSSLIPELFEVGDNYLIIEFIDGPSLKDIVIEEGLSKNLVIKIIKMLKEMEKLGFTRLDVAPYHVIITKEGKLKLIDHVNSYTKEVHYPIRLLNFLKRHEQLDFFLRHVMKIDEEIYREWKQNIPEYFN